MPEIRQIRLGRHRIAKGCFDASEQLRRLLVIRWHTRIASRHRTRLRDGLRRDGC